jgi:ribokinase
MGEVMILVAGSANLDFVVRANHIPLPGETVLGDNFQTFPGGKGANQAVASARAGGAPTHLLAAIGADAFAQPIEASLLEANVHLHALRDHALPTGCAFICVSFEGENAITVAPGANAALGPEHLPPLSGFSHLLLQLETPLLTVTAYAMAARNQGVIVVLNAAPAQALAKELLAHVDILVVNQGELATVAGHAGTIVQCLKCIEVPTLVVTLGARGCIARSHGEMLFAPAFPVTTIDTTAAGDSFCGVLIAALSQGNTLEQALRRANAAGAMACTRVGAQASIPSAAEVDEFLAKQSPPTQTALETLRAFCGTL